MLSKQTAKSNIVRTEHNDEKNKTIQTILLGKSPKSKISDYTFSNSFQNQRFQLSCMNMVENLQVDVSEQCTPNTSQDKANDFLYEISAPEGPQSPPDCNYRGSFDTFGGLNVFPSKIPELPELQTYLSTSLRNWLEDQLLENSIKSVDDSSYSSSTVVEWILQHVDEYSVNRYLENPIFLKNGSNNLKVGAMISAVQ